MFVALTAGADTPGKKPMGDSRITVKNINRFSDYDFFWIGKYSNKMIIIKSDTTVAVPGSGGAPDNGLLWAVNRSSKTSTDTLYFENYYAPDYEVAIDTIDNNKLRYSKREISNNNSSGGIIADENEGSGGNNMITLFATISLAALLMLVLFFMRRKKKEIHS
jgi:hypothetical protein